MVKERRGWVEVRRCGPQSASSDKTNCRWDGIINLSSFLGRDHDLFSGLAGITLTVARFSRLASYRGLPPDISREAGDDYLTSVCVIGETWTGWPEIRTIDWEGDFGGGPDDFAPDENEPPTSARRSASSPVPVMAEQTIEVIASIEVGSDLGGWQPQRRLRRRLFRLMAALAADYGPDSVRLVVWLGS